MSEVLQGVVFTDTEVAANSFMSSLPRDLQVIPLPSGYLALMPPSRDLDMAYGAALAAQVSGALGSALHVAYDNRVGLRHSQLFRQGSPVVAFGIETERWHPLRDSGEPDTSQTLSTNELLPAGEYETAEDAVTQGLRAFGLGRITGQDLVQLACYEGEA